MKESDVLAACMELLRRGYASGRWDRVSSPAKIYKGRPQRPSNTGMADIIGCYKGRFVAIECKAPGVKLRKDQQKQQDWGAAVAKAGGLYIIARSPEDVTAILEELT